MTTKPRKERRECKIKGMKERKGDKREMEDGRSTEKKNGKYLINTGGI